MDHIDYKLFLAQVKEKIENAQIKTALAANSQMLYLYWQLGNLILKNQANKGWGAKIVQLLAKDFNKEFPIENNLFERQVSGSKINNFNSTLPTIQSDFANDLLKDPYIFDFVQAKQKADERDIEEQLTTQITKFLLELGQGFAFVGRQVKFTIGNQDFYADLIFYHIKLRCYVVVELKARPFEPGDASQLNFYLNVVNEKMKTDNDNDTIGLLLCKGKNNLIAAYSLKGYSNAIGISDYVLSKAIPDALKSSLPQIEDIENELKETE